MNETQRQASIAIVQHGPMSTLQIARKIGIGSERLRQHLTEQYFVFEWAPGKRRDYKIWRLRNG